MIIMDPLVHKEREVKNLHITHHTVPNDETGKEESRKCVEYTVIGKQTQWNAYTYYDEFKKANPTMEVE